jgi:GNAT superfamily N-acetyltransferase
MRTGAQPKAQTGARPRNKSKAQAKGKPQVDAAAEAAAKAKAEAKAEEKALAADANRLKPRNKKTSAERALVLLQRMRQSPTQYWSLAGDLEIVHSSRKGTAMNLRTTLRTDGKEGEHIEVLRAAAHALTFEDGCHGDDVAHGYVLRYMVSLCTDAFVAFVNEVPVGFALLDQSAPTEIDLGMICASEKARGAGKALLQKAIDLAQSADKTLTLSSLPTVVSYYAKHGFQLGKTCGDHADLEHKALAHSRVVKKGRNYDYSQVAPLFEELHRKKMAVRQDGICGDPKATFAQLQDEGCHMDGYYMHLCPPKGRKAARALSPVRAASPVPPSPTASPVPSARSSPVPSARSSPVPSARPSPAPSARPSPAPSPSASPVRPESPAPRAPPTSPVVRAAKGANGAKQLRAARADNVPRPRDGLRRVTQKELRTSYDPKAVWRRKTKDGRVQLLSRQDVEEELERREYARTSKRVQRDDDRRARSAERKVRRSREASERKARRTQEVSARKAARSERKARRTQEASARKAARSERKARRLEAADTRKQEKGKCASAKQVREKGGNLRVCSGNPKYANAVRLNQQRLKEVEDAKGKRAAKREPGCASAREVKTQQGDGLYVCSGDARYGNYARISKKDLAERERAWGKRCASKKAVVRDQTGDLRYCVWDGHERQRLSNRHFRPTDWSE